MSNPETLIIDVRPDTMREEFGYFECSTQLVYSEMARNTFYQELMKLVDDKVDHTIFIYCESGQYAMFIQQQILDAGFTNVIAGEAYEDLLQTGCTCPLGTFFYIFVFFCCFLF